MAPDTGAPAPEAALRHLLQLERTSTTTFVSAYLFPDPFKLFGGQITAQALMAAGSDLPEHRLPHSLHGYFLRPGDAAVATEFEVENERDGQRFSTRRVHARQSGRSIFTMIASFHDREDGPAGQRAAAPEVSPPERGSEWVMPRAISFEARAVEQDIALPDRRARYWARCTAELGGSPLVNASALAYACDSTNAVNYFSSETHRASTSLDYALWFHRVVDVSEWMLMDLLPHTVAHGRGFYTGSVFSASGTLLATHAEETLFHPRSATIPGSRPPVA